MMRPLLVFLPVVITLLLSACGGVSPIKKQSRAISFESATATYAKLMRWGYFDEAANYVRSQDGSDIEVDLDHVAKYRVTSYKNTTTLLVDTGDEGRVVAAIEYYEIDSGVIKTLRDEQFWWYDPEVERWFLASPLPQFGAKK